jgi:hypothetical protein
MNTKAEHRMGRNYLKGRDGDRINAVLAAAGYNFSLLPRWLASLLCALIRALFPEPLLARSAKTAAQPFFTADQISATHRLAAILTADVGRSAVIRRGIRALTHFRCR